MGPPMTALSPPEAAEGVKAHRNPDALRAPFPYFGGKSGVSDLVWAAFGEVKQYIEPFCGSAAMLLAAPSPASLEVVGDVNCYIANFWRAVRYQPDAVWAEADYPVSHIDLAARHRWLVEPARVADLVAQLADPEWPGDARIAGWWCWGQCAWIGSGWCEIRKDGRTEPRSRSRTSPTPDAECNGRIPFTSHGGMGIQSREREREREDRSLSSDTGDAAFSGASLTTPTRVPHHSDAGMGIQRCSFDDAHGVRDWMRQLSARLARVRVIHGDWTRCLNMHYGDKGASAAIFFDPPYLDFEKLYRDSKPVAVEVAKWAATRPDVRIAVCGHVGDYDGILDGWRVQRWDRARLTYGGGDTTALEAIWFSPACLNDKPVKAQTEMLL